MSKKVQKFKKPGRKTTAVGNGALMPYQYLMLKNARREMTDEEIVNLKIPLARFIDRMKAGQADGADYQLMIDVLYNFMHLIKVLLEKKSLSPDPEYDLETREHFTVIFNQTQDWAADLIASIGERYRKTGKYGATADEYEKLEFLNRNWGLMLECADYGDWFVSYKRTQDNLMHLRQKKAVTEAANDESK